jgi:hypothetical protein
MQQELAPSRNHFDPDCVSTMQLTFCHKPSGKWQNVNDQVIGNQLAREKDTREFATMMNPVFFQKFAANIYPEYHQCSLFFFDDDVVNFA